jgi:hypothetical protein
MEPLGIDSPKLPLNVTSGTAYYGPRFDYNPQTLASLGLLIEEARTNSLTFSYDFTNAAWVKVALTVGASVSSPDGLTNGRVFTSTLANAMILGSVTTTAVAWDFSIWLRRVSGSGNVDITLDGTTWVTQTLTSTWKRFDVSQTGIAGTSTPGVRIVASGDVIEAFGAQAEAGAFATSLIPTFGSAQPRSVDQARVEGSAFTSGYSAAQGTIFAEFVRGMPSVAATTQPFSVSNNGNNDRIQAQMSASSGDVTFIQRSGGTNYDFGTGAPSTALNATGKVAITYSAAGSRARLNGGAVFNNATAVPPVGCDRMWLGANAVGAVTGSNYVSRISLYNTVLTDAQLQTLTT